MNSGTAWKPVPEAYNRSSNAAPLVKHPTTAWPPTHGPRAMVIPDDVDPTPAPKWLDTWWPWLNGAIALIIISYAPMLYQLIRDIQLYAPPENLRFW